MTEKEVQQKLIHPSSIAIVLVLMGVTSLFFALSIAYIYSLTSSGGEAVHLPIMFYFNMVVLMLSSYFFWKARKSFEQQSYEGLMRNLVIVMLTTTLFLVLQIIAWYLMVENQLSMQRDTSHGYLYAISILHFLHVVAGIPVLGVYMWKMYLEFKHNEDSLFFIEESPSRKLRLIGTYWHFIDILWIYLMLFFAINTFF